MRSRQIEPNQIKLLWCNPTFSNRLCEPQTVKALLFGVWQFGNSYLSHFSDRYWRLERV